MTPRGLDRRCELNLRCREINPACARSWIRSERSNGPQPNELPQYSDARVGGDCFVLHLRPQPRRRIRLVIGSLGHIRLCPWWLFSRWWFPWRRIPWWWLSWRRIWPRSGSGPLRTVWMRIRLSLRLRRILSLRSRRWRLLCGSATRPDALRLADRPRLGLRVIAAVRHSA